jgi:sugar phosphate isomerase/epimerase
MQYAVFTASLPEYTPEEAVKVLKDLGYDGIEWRVTDQAPSPTGAPGFWAGNRCTWPLASFVEDAPRIRALTEGAGLGMPNVGTYATCENLDLVEKAMQGTRQLGAPSLRVNVPKYDSRESYLKLHDRSVGQYREVAALAKQYGVKALAEIHHGNLIPSASAAAGFLNHFDPAHVGAIHDAGNMVHEGYENYRLGLEVLGPYLAHVHLKNAQWTQAGKRGDGSADWRSGWASVSGGVVDMAALFRALRQVGYDGWLSFEDFSTDQPLYDRMRDNLTYIKGVAQHVLGEG